MLTLDESPTPVKKNPDWNNQVKLGRGYYDPGAFARAIDVAGRLFKDGKWDGRGLLVVHDAYDTHRKMWFWGEDLEEGRDYEFAADSVYKRRGRG